MDMIDVMTKRRRIILNEPHPVSLSGQPVHSFNTDMAAPLSACKVYFEPVQAGSGDPSVDNIRPITGWTGCTVYNGAVNGTPIRTVPISWQSAAGTVYGGYVDLVNGEVVCDRYCHTFNGTENWTYMWGDSENNGVLRLNASDAVAAGIPSDRRANVSSAIASFCKISGGVTSGTVVYGLYMHANGYMNYRDATYCNRGERSKDEMIAMWKQQLADALANGTPYQLCVTLTDAGIIRYQLSPVQLKTLVGANNIWSNANGNIDLTYWGHSEVTT